MPAVLTDAAYRKLFDAAPGPYLILAPDLTIVGVNEAYLRATLTRREEIVGRGIFDVFPDNPDDPAATGVQNLGASLRRVLAHQRPDTMAVQKYDIRRPDGTFEERYWSPINCPVFGDDGEIILIIHHVQDVTEYVRHRGSEQARESENEALRHRAEHLEAEIFLRAQELQAANEQLRKASEEIAASQAKLMQRQRMEAVGQLTGGVAHDFNNLLTAVLGNLDLLEKRPQLDDSSRHIVQAATRAALRGARLTQQLLAFGRRQTLHVETLSINALLQGFQVFLQRALGEAIELTMHLDPSPCICAVDVPQFEAALLNLALNARDAMPNGGSLRIATRCEEHRSDDHSNGEDWKPGRYVAIAVEDTGCGMPKEVRARAFEPFFTTKDVNKGSGLGLSQVYGFVRQMDGQVTIDSSEGRGTTVTIYLPEARQKPVLKPAPASEAGAATAEIDETILVVEDDDDVRRTVVATLASLGYRILTAANGIEALNILGGSQRIDLVFADVVMPQGISGVEVAKEAARLRKGTKVLLTSGYAQDVLAAHGASDNFAVFAKPFRQQDLASEVRRILSQ